jgi:signal transduction histidine kinase
MICLALVAAILIAVRWVSPETLPKIWPFVVILLCVAAIAFYLSYRSISLRIRRLKAITERAAAGDFAPFERDHGHDELAELADALSRAVGSLGQTIHTLTDERNRSSAILSSMVEGVAVVAGDERILFCNWAFEQILELPEGSSEGRTIVEALRQADLVALVRQALPGAEEVTGEVEVGTVRRRNFSVTAAPCARPARTARCWCFTTSPSCAGSSACGAILSPTSRTSSRHRSPQFRVSRKHF